MGLGFGIEEKLPPDLDRAEEHPPTKIARGPKLPKPAVPHVYVKTGLGFGWEERMPPQ